MEGEDGCVVASVKKATVMCELGTIVTDVCCENERPGCVRDRSRSVDGDTAPGPRVS